MSRKKRRKEAQRPHTDKYAALAEASRRNPPIVIQRRPATPADTQPTVPTTDEATVTTTEQE